MEKLIYKKGDSDRILFLYRLKDYVNDILKIHKPLKNTAKETIDCLHQVLEWAFIHSSIYKTALVEAHILSRYLKIVIQLTSEDRACKPITSCVLMDYKTQINTLKHSPMTMVWLSEDTFDLTIDIALFKVISSEPWPAQAPQSS